MSATEAGHILDLVRERRVELIHLQFMDIEGSIKAVTIPASQLAAAIERGVWFDGSAVYGTARIVESDYCLRPDLTTFSLVPWESYATARVLCGVVGPDGEPLLADPRRALKEALLLAAERGFEYRVACEIEFFIFEMTPLGEDGIFQPRPVDHSSYFEISGERAQRLSYEAVAALEAFGFKAAAAHHEVGPSQYELDIPEMDALAMADAIVSLKWTLRVLARREAVRASFMPKPLADRPGSGLHFHQVLVDLEKGANAFADPAAPYQLGEIGRSFVAGQLTHARGMCAILAPLVNSYKRLGGQDEAPSRVCWARSNRGALIRVPEATGLTSTQVELRAPDPSCNPYLALAAALRAGLDGIEHKLTLPEPMEQGSLAAESQEDGSVHGETTDRLPADLGEALEELDWSPVVRDALGHQIYEQFLAAKEVEWAEFRRHVSAWELERYLDRA